MPGVVQHTQESLRKEVRALADLGVPGGDPLRRAGARRTPRGSGGRRTRRRRPGRAAQPARRGGRRARADGRRLPRRVHRPRALRRCSRADGHVDNDATLERYASIAVAQADAGADVVAPSGMMDGQVGGDPRTRSTPPATRHRDPRLRGEVRVGALRPVPRRGRVRAAVRRPPRLPDGSRQRARGARRGRARRRRGRRHGDGEAGARRTST